MDIQDVNLRHVHEARRHLNFLEEALTFGGNVHQWLEALERDVYCIKANLCYREVKSEEDQPLSR